MAIYTTLSSNDFENPDRANAAFAGSYGCTTEIDTVDAHSGVASLLIDVTDNFAGFSQFYNGYQYGADVGDEKLARVYMYYKSVGAVSSTPEPWILNIFWEKSDGADWFVRMDEALSIQIPMPAVSDWTLVDSGILRVPDQALLLAREWYAEDLQANAFSWRLDDELVQAISTVDLARVGIDANATPHQIHGTATRRK